MAQQNLRVAVLLPCYNEETAVAQTVAAFRAALPDAAIYVYDNNSSDGTRDVAAAAGAIVRSEKMSLNERPNRLERRPVKILLPRTWPRR